MENLSSLKVKIDEWLSIESNRILLKKSLEKFALILIVATVFLPFKELLGALAIWICIFVTYLNWKYK